jgi:hypothetical protein
MWGYRFEAKLLDSEELQYGECDLVHNPIKNKPKYNIEQVKPRLWRIVKNDKFLFMMKANNFKIVLDTLNRFSYEDKVD